MLNNDHHRPAPRKNGAIAPALPQRPGAPAPRRCGQAEAARSAEASEVCGAAKGAPGSQPRTHPTGRDYDRVRDLPRLVPLWPKDLADDSRAGRVRLLKLLRRALRAERQRGIGGHWAYDLARHSQLLAAYRNEVAALRALADRGVDTAAPREHDPRPGAAA